MATHYCDKCMATASLGVVPTKVCDVPPHHFVPISPSGTAGVNTSLSLYEREVVLSRVWIKFGYKKTNIDCYPKDNFEDLAVKVKTKCANALESIDSPNITIKDRIGNLIDNDVLVSN